MGRTDTQTGTRPKRAKRWLWLLSAALVLLVLNRCTPFFTSPVVGRVVHGRTGEPIVGAYVVAVWDVHQPQLHGEKGTWCQRNQTTITNQQGYFWFYPALVKPHVFINKKTIYVRVYKPGMIADLARTDWPQDAIERSAGYQGAYGTVHLMHDNLETVRPYLRNTQVRAGSWGVSDGEAFSRRIDPDGKLLPAARISYLDRIAGAGGGCGEMYNELPFRRAVCEEAKMLARTERDREVVFGRYSEVLGGVVGGICPDELGGPLWSGASRQHRRVFEQIEKDFSINLEGMPH